MTQQLQSRDEAMPAPAGMCVQHNYQYPHNFSSYCYKGMHVRLCP